MLIDPRRKKEINAKLDEAFTMLAFAKSFTTSFTVTSSLNTAIEHINEALLHVEHAEKQELQLHQS